MDGLGVPIVTPFDESGAVDEVALRSTVDWVTDAGVDFVLACGSTGEAELMTLEERARVVEMVAAHSSIPVLAGVGHPGLDETLAQFNRLPAVVEGALVVTPFYFDHDQEALITYYRTVADAVDVPIYLYSVPSKTGVSLTPETVGKLARHDSIHGMKDSSGDLVTLQRELHRVDENFELFVGHGGVLVQGIEAGAAGGILALANVVPKRVLDVIKLQQTGRNAEARELSRRLVELNRVLTAEYGVPGVKAGMRLRDVPAGHVRAPHRPVDETAENEIETLLESVLGA